MVPPSHMDRAYGLIYHNNITFVHIGKLQQARITKSVQVAPSANKEWAFYDIGQAFVNN